MPVFGIFSTIPIKDWECKSIVRHEILNNFIVLHIVILKIGKSKFCHRIYNSGQNYKDLSFRLLSTDVKLMYKSL